MTLEQEQILEKFVSTFIQEQSDLDLEIARVLNENFWDILECF